MKVQLRYLALARSGDKADAADLSLFAPDDKTYEFLVEHVTPTLVEEHFKPLASGPVERYLVPRLQAIKFVVHGALNGGASRSLRSDNLGKAMGSALLRLEVEVEDPSRVTLVPTIDGHLPPGWQGAGDAAGGGRR
ncbi:MAG: AtuA-related protein [Symbiobacteriia bacterium]